MIESFGLSQVNLKRAVKMKKCFVKLKKLNLKNCHMYKTFKVKKKTKKEVKF